MVNSSVWENPDEFVVELSATHLAHALIANDQISLLELIQLLLCIQRLHVGHVAADPSVFFYCKHMIKHVAEVQSQVVLVVDDFPVVWDAFKHLVWLELVAGTVFLKKVEGLVLHLLYLGSVLNNQLWVICNHQLLLLELLMLLDVDAEKVGHKSQLRPLPAKVLGFLEL